MNASSANHEGNKSSPCKLGLFVLVSQEDGSIEREFVELCVPDLTSQEVLLSYAQDHVIGIIQSGIKVIALASTWLNESEELPRIIQMVSRAAQIDCEQLLDMVIDECPAHTIPGAIGMHYSEFDLWNFLRPILGPKTEASVRFLSPVQLSRLGQLLQDSFVHEI